MASTSDMLKFIHAKDKSTLSKRYTPAQLEAAFKAMGGGAKATPTPAPVPTSDATPAPVPSALPDVSMKDLGQTAVNTAAANLDGSALATTFNPTLPDRYTTGDLNADRQKTYDVALSYLSKNFERDKGREEEATRQRLANQGIAFSADPNSRYQQEIGGLNERYDNLMGQYQNQAFLNSGQELERMTGIGETVRQNSLGEQAGIRNQTIGELQGLTGLDQLAKDYALKQKALQIQQQGLKRSGGVAPPASTPFNNSAPPGL